MYEWEKEPFEKMVDFSYLVGDRDYIPDRTFPTGPRYEDDNWKDFYYTEDD